MVGTRSSAAKMKAASATQNISKNFGNKNETATTVQKPAGLPSCGSSSVSGSGTVRSRTLFIEADYAQKILMLERATAERERDRERLTLEHERAALELRKQAEIAALEERGNTCSDRSRRSSRVSHGDIQKWVNDCVNVAIADTDLTKEPQNVNILTDLSVNRPSVHFTQRSTVASVSPVEVPNNSCISIANNISNPSVPSNLKHPTCSSNNIIVPSTEIAQLAQAIASLNNNTSRPKFGDGRLPSFDGKAMDWLILNRTYEDTKVMYSASDNLTRINLALKGAAREAVSVLLVSARDPSEVMEALAIRFGKPEHIILQEVAALRALPKINNSEGEDLHKFAYRVRNSVEVLRLLNEKPYLDSPDIYQTVLSKLPLLLRTRWQDYAYIHFPTPSGDSKLQLLARFLAREVDLQLRFGLINETLSLVRKTEKVHAAQFDGTTDNSISLPSTSKIHKNNSISSATKFCYFCSKNHDLCLCDSFKSLTVTDRWQFVKDKKLCHKCLVKGAHSYKKCRIDKDICNIKKCNSAHHKLLHIAYIVENEDDQHEATSSISEQPEEASNNTNEVTDFIAHASNSTTQFKNLDSSRPVLKILPVTVSGPAGSADTYALLDDGATATFIDSELARQIGVKGPTVESQLKCVSGLSKNVRVEYVDFDIQGRHTHKTHRVCQARSIKSLQLAKQSVCPQAVNAYPYLSDLKSILCYDNVQPKIVIGIDNWHLTLPLAVRKGSNAQPAAIKTHLGWVLFGFCSSRTKPVVFVNHMHFDEPVEFVQSQSIETLLKDQYKLDSIGISKKEPRSADDERAIHILERTANHLPCGRFEVGLLWKSDNPTVPNSYPLALSRFLSLEKKMISDPVYAERYKANIHDLINKDYAEKCQTAHPIDSICWYLPHFGVVNPNKPAKLRLVHDAAAKIKGVSLNSLLLTGPDLLQSLYNILLRFREGKVAMTADIKEMFPRFKIREQDRDAQRFLWRDSPNELIQTFRMSSMIFGAVCSPCTASYLKNKNALEVKDQFPQTVNAIIHDTYMDDFIGSVTSSDVAAQLAADIVHVHARAGLEMRGWVSNDPLALKLLPRDLISETVAAHVNLANFPPSTPCVRALGLYWHPSTDLLSFNTPTKNGEELLPQLLTKRIVLSLIMRIFDPLGILAPVVIRGRILFQNAWRMNLDWDTELPLSETKSWTNWFQDLISTSQLKIPRCYNSCRMEPSQVELHVFADASAQAYAAVAYWRFLFSNGDIQLALICSKSRVTPLKPSSIPRLELQAALIAARLATSIVDAVRLNISRRIFWSDSMNVLGWLRNDARTYKPFIAHRVGEIIELTDVKEWRWVPTGLNPADDATRLGRGSITPESRWFKGPDFLLAPETEWPIIAPSTSHNTTVLETQTMRSIHEVAAHIIINQSFDQPLSADSRRFSSWSRLIRATAYAHKYLSLLRLHSLRKKGIYVNFSHKVPNLIFTFHLASTPTPNVKHNHGLLPTMLIFDDLQLATTHVLRKSQLDSFSQEINSIRNRLPVSSHSRLAKLPATLDDEKVLRLSTRIVEADDVNQEVKKPALLDGKHPTVRLLVLNYHQRSAHANTELVVNELRQRFWILSLRNTVRTVAFNCQFCKIRRSITYQPPMGNLPAARLAHHCRPFSFVGLDYFGPTTVTVGRRSEKRWVALYTCLTVRAVHLEIVRSLSSDAAIMALRRFIARRGTPTEIHSDNGTSFVGANRELKTLYAQAVPDFAANEMIKWKFIPPSAPFMAGSWERLVRSVKTALKVTLGANVRTPTEEVFSTLLCEAEALVNSRPLTHISCDPEYPEALTPSHFILGSSSGRPIPAELNDRDDCSRSGWKRAVRMADRFWTRWVLEYLPTLSPRRTTGQPPAITLGDLVVIADGTLPRGSWPKGRIVATYPGKDGVIRVVDIATQAGVLRRPVKKVVPLV